MQERRQQPQPQKAACIKIEQNTAPRRAAAGPGTQAAHTGIDAASWQASSGRVIQDALPESSKCRCARWRARLPLLRPAAAPPAPPPRRGHRGTASGHRASRCPSAMESGGHSCHSLCCAGLQSPRRLTASTGCTLRTGKVNARNERRFAGKGVCPRSRRRPRCATPQYPAGSRHTFCRFRAACTGKAARTAAVPAPPASQRRQMPAPPSRSYPFALPARRHCPASPPFRFLEKCMQNPGREHKQKNKPPAQSSAQQLWL